MPKKMRSSDRLQLIKSDVFENVENEKFDLDCFQSAVCAD